MKKFLILTFALVTVLVFVACSGTSDESDTEAPILSNDEHAHVFAETVSVEATCSTLGQKIMKCSCGITEGDKIILPYTPHNAKAATCTEDSICADCGKLLVEKYEHFYVDVTVTDATCTTTGLAKNICHRCGDSSEIIIESSHSFDYTKLTVSNGNLGSTCTKCGIMANFEETKTLLKLDFDSINEFSNYPLFKKSGKEPVYSNGAARMGGAVLLTYASEVLTSSPKLLLSFDFQMVDVGHAEKGESILSFLGTPAGGATAYNWIFKYYENEHVFSTATDGFNESNSVNAERGEWYNCTAIIIPSTREINVYIDGISIGTRPLPNHSSANGKYQIRIYDAMPGNGTSNPMYDNLKLVEIK